MTREYVGRFELRGAVDRGYHQTRLMRSAKHFPWLSLSVLSARLTYACISDDTGR